MRLLSWLLGRDFVWAGWLYGDPSDVEELKALGVHGPMVWKATNYHGKGKSGIIERCLCDDDTLNKLVVQFNPGFSFSVEYALTPYPRNVFSPSSYKKVAKEWGWTKE